MGMNADERTSFADSQREMVFSGMELFFMSLYKLLAAIAEESFYSGTEEEWLELRLDVCDRLAELAGDLIERTEDL